MSDHHSVNVFNSQEGGEVVAAAGQSIAVHRGIEASLVRKKDYGVWVSSWMHVTIYELGYL